jgi:flotillin
MGHINSLTVMSADGASDLVKNATRAMIESTTAIKGLTGLDVPSLIGGAMGRGFGERLRTGDGDGGSDVGSAADRISQIAGEGLSTLKAARAEAEAKAKEAEAKAAEDSKKAAAAADKAATAATVVASKLEASGAVQTTSPATVAKPAAPAAPWSTVPQAKADAMAGVSASEGSVAQWGKWMADQLRQVPNIQLYDALRLVDLADKGPAPARAVWQTAQAVLVKDFGTMTVADLLKRFHP